MSFSLRIYAKGLYFIDFEKLFVFNTFMSYLCRFRAFPISIKIVPFVGVTENNQTGTNYRKLTQKLRRIEKKNKKMKKALREQRKAEKRRAEEERQSVEEARKKEGSFLSKVGNAIVKAIPALLKVAIPVLIKCLFSHKTETKYATA